MNYEKMWNDLKFHIAWEKNQADKDGKNAYVYVKLLAHMSLMEASEYENERCGYGEYSEPDNNTEPDEILKKFFKNDYVDNLKDLEKKLMEKGRRVIMANKNLKIPERFQDMASERGIIIGRVSRQDACVRFFGMSFMNTFQVPEITATEVVNFLINAKRSIKKYFRMRIEN